MATVPTVSIGEAEACSVALEGTLVRELLRHPAAILGILESGNLDGTCEPELLSQGLSTLNLVAVSTQWGVGDDLESLGNLPKCSERCRSFDFPLLALVHRDLYGFFLAILMSSDKIEISTIIQRKFWKNFCTLGGVRVG